MNEPSDDDEEPGSSRPVDEEAEVDDARRVILARRARFVALALASAGIAAGCGGKTDGDSEQTSGSGGMQATGGGFSVVGAGGGTQVCLFGGAPQVCLSDSGPLGGAGGFTGEPDVCLSFVDFDAEPPPLPDAGSTMDGATDAGGAGGATGTGGAGGLPQVCLRIDPSDAGSSDGSA